jgi:hypothetical protein
MRFRSSGHASDGQFNDTFEAGTFAKRRRVAPAVESELLEKRRLLSAVVVAPTTAPTVGTSPLAPMPGKTFWVNANASSNAWQFNSAITPNTTNDLVLNVAPFAYVYNPCCEGGNAAPGNTAQAAQLLTNGLTQNQIGAFPSSGAVAATGSGLISDASSGANVLSDLADANWFMEFNLGGQPGATPAATGYDISEIDVITGHQDYRTGQNTDIQMLLVGGADWISLSNGRNFNFTSDQTGATLSRGAAQMAVVNSTGGAIVSNVQAVKFVASNTNTWYRELIVTGTATSALPASPPSTPTGVNAVNDPNNPDNVDLNWVNSATGAANNPSEYQILRAPVVNGVVGSFTQIAQMLGTAVGTNGSYVDLKPPSGIYVYKVVAFSSFAGGTSSASAASSSVSVHVLPAVISINRSNPVGPSTNAATVSYTVTFNESVVGVTPSNFGLALNGVTATTPVVVSGSGSSYTVTVNGILGNGTLGLNLVDNGTISDPGRTLTFASQQTVATGSHPRAIVAADVNGDGKSDLVVANLSGHSVGVLIGNGDGTFQAQRSFVVGTNQTYPVSVAVADVNGDGKPDLIVANDGFLGSVSVLLGNGNGTFLAQQMFPAGVNPYSVAVGDLNGDGKPDIVVANNGAGSSASVLLGNGNGTFQPRLSFQVDPYPRSVAIADVNGDGKPDLITANYLSNDLSVLLGNGNGTFQAQSVLSGGQYPQSLTAADVNGDGKIDLVVTNYQSSTVSVLLGNGNGTFQGRRAFGTGAGPIAVAVADKNKDGKPDLIVANEAAGTVSFLLGNGNGTFQSQQTFAAAPGPVGVAVMDLNGDSKPDAAVADFNANSAGILLDSSNLNFIGQTYTILPFPDSIFGTGGSDNITLTRDADGLHIDWTLNGGAVNQMAINDPNGLTINGNGGNETVTLIYTNGNPLPNTVHLNGIFTILGLTGTNPLAGVTLDIGRSTLFINYASASDPIAAIKSYLATGYNGGAWNGTPTASTGVITSAAAQANPNHNTAIGYADSGDGQGVNTTPNTIELKYTLTGDANLDGQVNSADLQRLLAFFNTSAAWDGGDFNYDGQVNSADLQAMLFTFNTALGNQASGALAAAQPSPPHRTSQNLSAPLSGPNVTTVVAAPRPIGRRSARPLKHR